MTTLTPLPSLRRRAAAISAPLLLALSLTACGGSDASGAPEDASVEEFCAAFSDFGEGFDSDDTERAVEAANDYAERLSEIGTPEDLSDEARQGFEAYVGYLGDVDEGDVEDLNESGDAGDIFGEGDADAVTTFLNEAGTACVPSLGDLESELPE